MTIGDNTAMEHIRSWPRRLIGLFLYALSFVMGGILLSFLGVVAVRFRHGEEIWLSAVLTRIAVLGGMSGAFGWLGWRIRRTKVGPAISIRRLFRYSLRSLFALVTIFCIWLGIQVKWVQDRHTEWQWALEYPGGGFMGDDPPEKPFPWILKMLGETPHHNTLVIFGMTEADVERARRLGKLFPEAYVHVGRAKEGEVWGNQTELVR